MRIIIRGLRTVKLPTYRLCPIYNRLGAGLERVVRERSYPYLGAVQPRAGYGEETLALTQKS